MSYIITFFALILAIPAIYQGIFAVIGLFYKSPGRVLGAKLHRFLVLIPGYKEDEVIIETARAACLQYYPHAAYEVVVIADSFKPETISALRNMQVQVHEVQFEQSTKSKALRSVLNAYSEDYEAVVVLDADNFMKPNFLERINDRLNEGYMAVQGNRSYKNWDSPIGALDGFSEMVNTHILCKGHNAMGLSARLAGSGMAFDFKLFKGLMNEIDAIGGFDKELELRLTSMGIHIGYDHDAIIYDEKVPQMAGFSKQRGRWLAAQYTYAARFFKSAWQGLLEKGNVDHFNKHLQTLLPPRLLLPVFLLFGSVFSPFSAPIWWTGLAFSLTGFAVSIPLSFWKDGRLFNAILHLPSAILGTFKALTWMPAASKRFLHTEHKH